jgi:hypothetical protein
MRKATWERGIESAKPPAPMSRTSTNCRKGRWRLVVDDDSSPGCSGGSGYRMAGIARAQSPCAFGDDAPRSLLSSVAIRLSK